jgi:hypothetical protein
MTAAPSVRQRPVRLLLAAAPLVFIVHFLEEAPGFVAWFNAHVSRGITAQLFWTVNLTGLAITIAVAIIDWVSDSAISAAIAVAWLSLLTFANALFHVVAAIVDRSYVPGLVTAVVLYLPFYAWFIARTVQTRKLPRTAAAIAATIGALPMLAHGYLIVFRGRRLF